MAKPAKAPDPRGNGIRLKRRGVERWRAGHPWIYRVDIDGNPKDAGGSVVRVLDERGWFLGQAFYSATSKISLRWVTDEDVAVDRDFFARRLAQADALRRQTFPNQDTYRVVHGEADLIPGLVVDRYGEFLSVQFLTQATEHRKALFVELLDAQFKPRAIVERSDVHVRTYEGLEPKKGLLKGTAPGLVPYRVGEVQIEIDLIEGQKTGAFLDQRENQLLSASYARGEALDCFSYAGGFALQLATRADKVTAVEISEPASQLIRRNAEANRFKNVEVVTANAFDFLRDTLDEGGRYDTIVLDPPSFAKNKASVEAALRGYKEINLRAMQLLRPGGHLITASCTYHVDEPGFEAMLESAANDSKRRVQIIERRGASRDHPVLLQLRETRYLKCFVLRVVS